MKTRTNAECEAIYAKFNMTITSNMICANDKYKNACKGDSGGPLAYFDQTYNYWTLIGVTSFGSPLIILPPNSCNVTEPSVFARVTAQLDWIKSHISGQTCPRPSS